MKIILENRQPFLDAGCSEEQADMIAGLFGQGREQDAIRELRKHRCRLMNELHEQQRKVDRTDYLIREQMKAR